MSVDNSLNVMDYPEERIIKDFPGPFLTNCSPYVSQHFSEKFRTLLKNYISSVTKVSKVIVIGDVAVGKTCLVNRFCRKMFDHNYKSTIGVDFEVEHFNILNIPYCLQILRVSDVTRTTKVLDVYLYDHKNRFAVYYYAVCNSHTIKISWDTAGQERFKSIAQSYYRGAHAVVIMFDLTNPESLSNCQTWLNEASHTFSSKAPFLFIVGTKKDLLKNYAYKNMEICATNIATKLNGEYWSISSKTGKNVNDLFKRIAALTFIESIKMEFDSRETSQIGNNLNGICVKKTTVERNNKCITTNCLN